MSTDQYPFDTPFRTAEAHREYLLERIGAQIRFARLLCRYRPEDAAAWRSVIDEAGAMITAVAGKGIAALESAVHEAESTLAPMAEAAKAYTIYCVAHAHIDMNWQWPWAETVGVTVDSFTTVLRLMEEFPTFIFSQSQASVYSILEDYRPDMLERVAALVAEGRWEVTASHWVEGDKNLASAESLCRHVLYTRRYMQRLFGLTPEAVPIDWAPDTFGHAHTVPSYLARAGVRYYYHHRPGVHGGQKRHEAFWWQAPDGSRVLARNDMRQGYNGRLNPDMVPQGLVPFVEETGLPFAMFVYGVGDHGGGPTRRDLARGVDMQGWPIFPRIEFSRAQTFFQRLEREGAGLPVLDCELNFEFSGCYTTQTLIKKANRYGEKLLVDAETGATLGALLAGTRYPRAELEHAWRDTLFSHFHDILPGSGVRDTRTYTHGLYQRTAARTNAVETAAYRAIAAEVDTSAARRQEPGTLPSTTVSPSFGAGVGRGTDQGGFSQYEYRSAEDHRAFVLFNPLPYARSETVEATVWDPGSWRESGEQPAEFAVEGPDGESVGAQVTDRGGYWGHGYARIAFPAAVPAMGYATYVVKEAEKAPVAGSVAQLGYGHPCPYATYERGPEGLENGLVRVLIDPSSGGIASFTDKRSGRTLISADGTAPSLLRYAVERPRIMSAWEIEHTGPETEPVVRRIARGADGAYSCTVEVSARINQSDLVLTYELRHGDPNLYLHLKAMWVERGGPDVGTPCLRLTIPAALDSQVPVYEIPFGAVERHMEHGEEVPALRWAAVTGTVDNAPDGLLLATDSKHGYSHVGNRLSVTLIRSSFEPDPLPEIGEHRVELALRPLGGALDIPQATMAARLFDHPVRVVSTDAHDGRLPRRSGLITWEAASSVLNAVKTAEDSDALLVRAYNPSEQEDAVRFRVNRDLMGTIAEAVEVDLLERPVETGSTRVEDGALFAVIPRRGIWSAVITLQRD